MADPCVDLVARLAQQRGIDVPQDELTSVIKEFRREIARKPVLEPSDLTAAFDIALSKTTQLKLAARQARREALIKLVKRKALNDRISSFTGKNIKNAYADMMIGGYNLAKGARDSAAARQSGLEKQFMGSLLRALNKEGAHLEELLRKGSLDKEITMYAYDRNANVSADAKKLHDIIYKHSNGLRERKNRAGAFIGEREDFIVTQQHDPQLIRKAGPEQWKRDILEKLDQDATLRFTDSSAEEYLDELYVRFSTGKHYLVDDGEQGLVGAPQTINLAKKISQSRKLHFADGVKAFEYAEKYTRGNIFEKLTDAARYDAKTITLMEMYGPNPKAMHKQILTDLEAKAVERGQPLDSGDVKSLDNQFAQINGELDIPGHIGLAHFGFGMRALESVSKLGGAVVSAFGDVGFKGATLNRRTDMGFIGSYSKAFTGLLDTVPASDKKHVASLTNIYTEAVLGSTFARAGAIDGMPGTIAKLQELFFRVNLLQGWTVNHKKGVAYVMAADLARYRQVSFDALPANTKRNLEMYNISADEWNLVKDMETINPETGNHFVTPGGVYSLSDDVIDAVISSRLDTLDVTENMRAQFKDSFSTKMQALFDDIADEAIVTPGARERRLMTAGTQKGTYLGELMRFLTQFKAFPVTVITKQLIPEMYANGGFTPKGFASLVPLITITTALGYLSGAAKDVMKGKEPKDPRNARAWADAFVRGGGAGIFGDFMFAEYSRYGRSFLETAPGPAFGTFNDFMSLAHKTATGKADSLDFFSFAKSILPGANLFYLESAANYMMLYGFIEAMEPGYLRRMERRTRKEYKQEYWLPPSQSAVQF